MKSFSKMMIMATLLLSFTVSYAQHAGHHTTTIKQETNQLKLVCDNYFVLKDALVKSDGNLASKEAKNLLTSINAVKMDQLTANEHTVWMNVKKDLVLHSEHISDTKDISHQRDHFTSLSKNMYDLMKVCNHDKTVYYQFCPMYDKGKGANWLSEESSIKNPYYGNKMLSCGKTVETIK